LAPLSTSWDVALPLRLVFVPVDGSSKSMARLRHAAFDCEVTAFDLKAPAFDWEVPVLD
jgi:hypothetical protein